MSGAQCTHLIGKGPSSEKYYDPSRQERETIAAPTDIHAISKERPSILTTKVKLLYTLLHLNKVHHGRLHFFFFLLLLVIWGGELFITCTLQQVHFGGETMKKGSFQCLMKQRTLTLLRETLLCLSFSIFSSFCRWLQLQTSKTCSIF